MNDDQFSELHVFLLCVVGGQLVEFKLIGMWNFLGIMYLFSMDRSLFRPHTRTEPRQLDKEHRTLLLALLTNLSSIESKPK